MSITNGNSPSWSVLVVPAITRGTGTGHLKRSMALVRTLRGAGMDVWLYLGASSTYDHVDKVAGWTQAEILASFPGELDPLSIFEGDPADRRWTFVLLDRFRTGRAEFTFWCSIAPVVGLDEGGSVRGSFDFLVNTLPALPSQSAANLSDPRLLDLPGRHRNPLAVVSGQKPLRVLVSFGGEDSAGLTEPAVLSLLASGENSGMTSGIDGRKIEVDVISGALASTEPNERMSAAGARVLGPVPNLKEQLADYDLLVTQYGLSAFEAAAAGISVLLVSPSAYHERLARSVHFLSAGVGRRAASRVAAYLPRLEEAAARAHASIGTQATASHQTPKTDPGAITSTGISLSFSPRSRPDSDDARIPAEIPPSSPLAHLISGISFPSGVSCPLCGARPTGSARVLGRFPDRTYRRCASCGMVFLTRTDAPPIQYARDYFFRDYKKQYGKTYLEDFFNLEKAGKARLDRIGALLRPSADRNNQGNSYGNILDIGCAYGPFLSAARSCGFSPYGMDPAGDAVRYVREELKIPAIEGFFPATDPREGFGVENFDAVTLWYVIEHFTELTPVLQAANRLLRTGGGLAFSTPSGEGVSARFRKSSFFEHSPADHFSVWEPSRTAGLLKRFGFTLEKITVTGHHPERFPGLSSQNPGSLAYRLAATGSRLFGLGDTYEAYAVKTASI